MRMNTLRAPRAFKILGWTAAAGAGLAAFNVLAARAAERRYRPQGRFLDVGRVRLHYIRRGQGEPLLLIHGNGATVAEMESSGLVDRLARRYDVLVFDRPGFGHSERPRGTSWTPEAQARLFHQALDRLGVERPTIVAHSFGTQVALAMALLRPGQVSRLVLISGFYFPKARLDLAAFASLGAPVFGDLMRYTTAPVSGRLLAPAFFRQLFAPNPVTPAFQERFPTALALRPSQLRAFGEDSAALNPAAARLAPQYARLHTPALIVAGAEDRIVASEQANRLAAELPQAELVILPGTGHMLHHFRADEIESALERGAHVFRHAERREEPAPTLH